MRFVAALLGAGLLLQGCATTTRVFPERVLSSEGRHLVDWVRAGEPMLTSVDRDEVLRSGVATFQVTCREVPRYEADVALVEKRVAKEGVSVPAVLANVGIGVGGTFVWLLGNIVVNLPAVLIEAACRGGRGSSSLREGTWLPYPELPWKEIRERYTTVELVEWHDVILPGDDGEARMGPQPGQAVEVHVLKDGNSWKYHTGSTATDGTFRVALSEWARAAEAADAASMEMRIQLASPADESGRVLVFGRDDLASLAAAK